MKVFTWSLCVTILVAVMAADAAAIQPLAPARAEKPELARQMERLGAGPNALVAARLRNKEIVSGYLKQSTGDGLVVVDPNSGRETEVAYAQVARLEVYNLVTGTEVHQGAGIKARLIRGLQRILPVQPVQQNNLSKGPLIVIGAAILVAIILIVKLT
jgi:hypothetical protein